MPWLESTDPLLWWDRADPELWYDSSEAADIADPIDPAEANEPMLANEAQDAALPIERNESWEQIERTEFSDQSDHTPSSVVPARRPGRAQRLSNESNAILTSITGVPSIASRPATRKVRGPASSTVTVCRPMGFGRSGERVAKTPVMGRAGSLRGRVSSVVPVRSVQPGQQHDDRSRFNPLQCWSNLLVEDQLGLGRPLVALPRRSFQLTQRRTYDADPANVIGLHAHLTPRSQSMLADTSPAT